MKKIILFTLSCLIFWIILGTHLNASAQESLIIPNWIKNAAKYWSQGQTSDADFTSSMIYLIEHGIITVAPLKGNDDLKVTQSNNGQIPSWIKNNAGYWANGDIDDSTFLQGIQYLVNNGIITPSILTDKTTTPTTATPPQCPDGGNTCSYLVYRADSDPIIIPPGTSKNIGIIIESKDEYQKFNIHMTTGSLGNSDYRSIMMGTNGIPAANGDASVSIPLPSLQRATAYVKISVGKCAEPGTKFMVTIQTYAQKYALDNSRVEKSLIIDAVVGSPKQQCDGTTTSTQVTPLIPPNDNQPQIVQLILPQNIVQEATGPTGTTVHFDASESSGGIPSCNPTSGSIFSIGSTTVKCTAVGSSSSSPVEGSFTVTVRDTTPPVISPFQPHNDTPDDSGAIVYFTISAVDLVDGPVTPSCDHASGEKFPLGVSTITCTATDSHGNTSKRSLQISITKS